MSNLLLLDAEAKLASDHDESYKTKLLELLNKFRDHFVLSRQGFLPPDEYQVAEHMEGALNAALAIIKDHKPVKNDTTPADEPQSKNFNTMINV